MPNNKSIEVSASSSSNRKPAAPAPAAAQAAAPPAPTPSPQPAPDANALAALAQQAVAMLDTLAAGLGEDPAPGPNDKRRAVRFRKGGGPIALTIGELAQQQQLELPAVPVATMTSQLDRANALAPLVSRLPALVTLVDDIVFAAQSQAWEIALQYYAILQRRAKTDAKLAAALQPVTAFLAYRHPSTKAPVGSPTTRQLNAAKRAQKTLATVAGGKLAGTNLLTPRKTAASAATAGAPLPAPASPAPATPGNGAPTGGAAPVTNGGTPPAAHS